MDSAYSFFLKHQSYLFMKIIYKHAQTHQCRNETKKKIMSSNSELKKVAEAVVATLFTGIFLTLFPETRLWASTWLGVLFLNNVQQQKRFLKLAFHCDFYYTQAQMCRRPLAKVHFAAYIVTS